MNRSTSILVSSLATTVIAACAGAPVPRAETTPAVPIGIAPSEPEALSPAPDRFPGGRGVSLVYDQLTEAQRATFFLKTYDERVAAVITQLGEKGTSIDGGTIWHAVGPRGVSGPYECYSLTLHERGGAANVTRTDHAQCGLPYRAETTSFYSGPGPRFTTLRLQRVLDEIRAMAPDEAERIARLRLSNADVNGVVEKAGTSPSVLRWSAIGGRDDEAPITCHVLVLGARTRIEQRDLADCGITWPPPTELFAKAAEAIAPVKVSDVAQECTKCGSGEVCVSTRTTPDNATLLQQGDKLTAIGLDGRPVPVDVKTSCTMVPPTCSQVQASCFVRPRDPGPCATTPEELVGYSFNKDPSGRYTLTCTARKRPKKGA